MLEPITEPFAQGIAQRALAELILLGAVCGPLGVWVVLYRQSYAAESIAHAMLPGLVLAGIAEIPLGFGAAGGLAVAAGAISLASRQRQVAGDVAIAVTITTLFGAGSLLALLPDAPLRLGELLFGNPLSVSDGDLLATAALALVVAVALAAAMRPLTLVGFDAQAAPSLGARGGPTGLILLLLLALTTLIAVQALGNLLVVAILIAPAAAALRLSSSLRGALGLSALLAIAAGIGGLYLSHYVDVAAGAAIALCAIAVFIASLPFGR